MEPLAVEEIAKRFAAALEKEMDNNRLSSLGSVLEALASKMNPRAYRGDCKGLAAALEREMDSDRLASLGTTLAGDCHGDRKTRSICDRTFRPSTRESRGEIDRPRSIPGALPGWRRGGVEITVSCPNACLLPLFAAVSFRLVKISRNT
jgi:hypothetical protein